VATRSSPSFAVAIPIGAWHPFIPAAFDSLACQDVSLDIALLDASGDDRVAAAADASGLQFTYRRHGADAGQSAAIDEGWQNTGGDIAFWLNGDDRLKPGALETVRSILEQHTDADIVYGHSDFIDSSGKLIGVHDQVAEMSDLLYRSNIVSQPSCFVRRAALDAVGGINRDLQYVMDWDLWVRLRLNGARFLHTHHTLSAVYIGDDTKTGEIPARRLKEVYELVRQTSGHWSAFKSTASLAAHTLDNRWRRAR
jgi:GT2 family glycosyltransferase